MAKIRMSFPLAAALFFSAANLFGMAPFIIYSERTPWFLSDKNPIQDVKWVLIVFASLGNSMVLISFYLVLQRCVGVRAARVIGGLCLFLIFALLNAAAFYYLEFGSYPNFDVIAEGLRSPRLIAGYALYGSEPMKLVAFVITLIPVILLIASALRSQGIVNANLHTFMMSTSCAAAFLLCLFWGSRTNVEYKVYGTFSNLSLPVFKLWDQALGRSAEAELEAVAAYLPQPSNMKYAGLDQALRPRHVVLVVMESLRADHLPFYGYQRQTMPKTSAAGWHAIERMYAHGPWTASAFAIIFSSRYLAAVSEGARAAKLSRDFWQLLGEAGIKSAFISSGDLEWGGVSSRIGAAAINLLIESKDATYEERIRFALEDNVDNSLSDRFALARYSEFLKNTDGRSFATLFLMGCHFPYRALDGNSPYQPAKPLAGAERSAVDKRTNFVNSYDNSILGFDTILDELLSLLRSRGLLQDTLIIATADHGESLGENGVYYHGFQLGEEQVRIPLLVYAGENLTGLRSRLDTVENGLHGQVDIAPTILDMFGLRAPDDYQGISLFSTTRKYYEIIPYSALARKLAIVTANEKYIYDLDTRVVSIENLSAEELDSRISLDLSHEMDLPEFLYVLEQHEIIHLLCTSEDR